MFYYSLILKLIQMEEETIEATAYKMKTKKKRGESKFPPSQATAPSDKLFNDQSFSINLSQLHSGLVLYGGSSS